MTEPGEPPPAADSNRLLDYGERPQNFEGGSGTGFIEKSLRSSALVERTE